MGAATLAGQKRITGHFSGDSYFVPRGFGCSKYPSLAANAAAFAQCHFGRQFNHKLQDLSNTRAIRWRNVEIDASVTEITRKARNLVRSR